MSMFIFTTLPSLKPIYPSLPWLPVTLAGKQAHSSRVNCYNYAIIKIQKPQSFHSNDFAKALIL